MTLIQAAVCHGPGESLVLEEIEISKPSLNEVRVTVEACAICHSDLAYIDGDWKIDYPVVLGHEVAGKISEIGQGTETDLKIGDRVVVSLIRTCGQCLACQRGHHVACTAKLGLHDQNPLKSKLGEKITQGLNTGGFAEEVLVHLSQCVPVTTNLPVTSAALLGCGVMTGVGSVVNTAQVTPGSSVVIIGCGGVGVAAIQAARISKAKSIIAIDPVLSKRKIALDFGATHAVDPDQDLAETVMSATGGYLADFVFVTTASPSAITSGSKLLAAMGSLVLVGMPADGVKSEFDPGMIAAQNQKILGSKMGTAKPETDIPMMVKFWEKGSLELESMVSSVHPLSEIANAIEEIRGGSVVRTVVCPGDYESGVDENN